MADALPNTSATPVVTLRSLLGAGGVESTGLESIAKQKEVIEFYEKAVEKLGEETAKVGADVLITVQDRETSVLQSRIAEKGVAGQPLAAGGIEAKFGEGALGGDILGWLGSVFDHVSKNARHAPVRPLDNKAGTLADTGRIAIVGDWGTNLYGAPVSAASIKRAGGYELLMHLGDIYYSGTQKESKQRFIEAWPMSAGKVSRALNGNHEMYSGGFAYYDDILPHFSQSSSYFAVQNTNWLLIGLDTAHEDHDLDAPQVQWLNAVVQNAGQRNVILFSHHQPFSRLEKQGDKLQAALANLFQKKAITAWYWGHEHDCIIYEKHQGFGLLGRCIGHGGIPSPRKARVKAAPTEKELNGGMAWKRLSESDDAPSCIVLDGPNSLVKDEEHKFVPHGYLTLEFNGPNLTERVHLPDGTEIFKGQVT